MQNKEKYAFKPYVELKHPEWSKNATIYEVNIRQYTPEGTFKAFENHIPRLKEMGVDILWIMPIHPIGELNRKGSLGSYYSVKDYYAVNPEFGTLEDFEHMVEKAHGLGMYVIIDWVANHSAWDNPLTVTHADWYTKTIDGEFQPTPWYDWDDVIDFDFENAEFREYMTKALKFWVEETNIDGYRCDVAGFIPVDFWDNVRSELEEIKPVFLLAEWESRDIHKNAFDMSYAWSLFEKLQGITTGNKDVFGLVEYMAHDVNTFPKGAYRMTFTDNHDMNSWNGTPQRNFGEGLDAAIVFCSVVNGMPLVYSGQEAGLDKSLKFFDKDLIEWKEHPHKELFTKLFQLKHQNQALWNGEYGGEMIRIYNDKMHQVVSFYREKNGDKVLSVFNFTNNEVNVKLNTKTFKGNYTYYFSSEPVLVNDELELSLSAWGYKILHYERSN